jgi:hypothetical protein
MLKPKIFKLAITAMIMSFLFYSSLVYADDTSLGRTPEGVFPIKESDVVMEAEDITVDLEKNTVECSFLFHNTGKSKNVYMGFPGKVYNQEDGLTDVANLELSNFKTFVKGKELAVKHEKADRDNTVKTNELIYSEYFTFTVPFNADEKINVKNTYKFTPSNNSIGQVFSGYVLKTGAMWKGKIGTAKITFKLGNIKPYEIEELQPEGFKFAKDTLVWERSNIEPDYDLRICYNIYLYRAKDLSFMTDDVKKLNEEIQQKKDSYNNIKKLAEKNAVEQLQTLYSESLNGNDPILPLYIKSYLEQNEDLAKEQTQTGKKPDDSGTSKPVHENTPVNSSLNQNANTILSGINTESANGSSNNLKPVLVTLSLIVLAGLVAAVLLSAKRKYNKKT